MHTTDSDRVVDKGWCAWFLALLGLDDPGLCDLRHGGSREHCSKLSQPECPGPCSSSQAGSSLPARINLEHCCTAVDILDIPQDFGNQSIRLHGPLPNKRAEAVI
jgi:hypothetical protein